MDEVFVDTAGWAALSVRTEPQYEAAATLFRAWRRERRRLVTTNHVLAGLVRLLGA